MNIEKIMREREAQIIDRYEDVEKCKVVFIDDCLDIVEVEEGMCEIIKSARIRTTIVLKNGKEFHDLVGKKNFNIKHLDFMFNNIDEVLDEFFKTRQQELLKAEA